MADLDLLRSIGIVVRFQKNQMVFLQYEIGENMYIVQEGLFGVYINSFTDFPIRVAGIQSGSFFGEMSIIDGWPRSATIISEDDGAALVIEKDKFGLLLEKCPDIAASILETLRNRATSTAESVRAAGKEAPPLPPLLRAVQFADAKRSMSFMTMLAQRVRQMNDLLTASAGTPKPETAPAQPQPSGTMTLLPEGYTPFDLKDRYDSSKLLAGTKGICPYCAARTFIYVPAFSRLIQRELTLDQRVIYSNLDILWYTNIVCSNCNYTDSYQEFTKPEGTSAKPRYSGNQFKNAEGFKGFAIPGDHTLDEVILSYYLRIACTRQTSNDPLSLAKAWIRLYWLYSDNRSEALAKQAAKEARDFYTKYADINDDNLNTEDKMRVNAILGELSVTLSDFDPAMEYFKENSVIGLRLNNDLYKQSLKRYNEIKRM